MNKEQLNKYYTRLGIEPPSPTADVERNDEVESAITQGGKDKIQLPLEALEMGDAEKKETKGEGHRSELTNTEEATEPMGDAKLKAKIKAEVLEELNLQQQLSSFSQQVNSDRKADLDSLEAKINKAIDEAIKNVIATHGHSSTDVVQEVKAELKAEAEAERQKAEAKKPKGMPWPLSILYK